MKWQFSGANNYKVLAPGVLPQKIVLSGSTNIPPGVSYILCFIKSKASHTAWF
jgi:hypothetical protein